MTRSIRAATAISMLAACAPLSNAIAQGSVEPAIARFSRASAGAALPAGWSPLTLKGIAPSRYTLVLDGDKSVVRAQAQASASGLAFAFAAPVANAWQLRWRWKGERIPSGASTAQRATDDAVARIYVTFKHPAERLSVTQRTMDRMLLAFYGEAPPHATLLYVWDNDAVVGTSKANAYTDRVRNIVVESGTARLGQWLAYERDVAADYRAAFGEPPPPIGGIALMTDADNTGSAAIAYYGDITLSVE